MKIKFADRMKSLDFSEVNSNYKYLTPDAISLANGQPDPAYFPARELAKAFSDAVTENPSEAFLYGKTQGGISLRKKIAERVNKKFGTHASADEVALVNGSQQGLDFIARALLNDGEYIACETPTYFGCFQAFGAAQAKYMEIPTDDEGMIPSELDKVLASDAEKLIKLIYVIPNFQNPTGRTWSLERRRAFMEVVNKYDVPVLEDDAYGELRYDGEHLPSLKSMDTKGNIIYSGSFSKILCPGIRLAYLIAGSEIINAVIDFKGHSDLHVPTSIEMMVDRYMDDNDIEAHIENVINVYRKKRDIMMDSIRKYFPEGCKYTVPEGGLFVWVEYPEKYDPDAVFENAGAEKVVFVQGKFFYAGTPNPHTMRLNFSLATDEEIREGVKKLGNAIKVAEK